MGAVETRAGRLIDDVEDVREGGTGGRGLCELNCEASM